MKRFYLLVEGQTEERFVRELLTPHYSRIGVFITPIILSTSPGHKGGVASYARVKPQLIRLCRQDRDATISTLIDLYALPNDFPGKAEPAFPTQGTGRQKAEFIEARLLQDIDEPNFLPHLMVHEYEALLFSSPQHFGDWADSPKVVQGLSAIAQAYSTPEDINDGPQTAPSKRILQLMPRLKKTFHGPLIAADIGLDEIRRTCPHFNDWLARLEQLAA